MAKPWKEDRITTKITREDMALAGESDPRRKVRGKRFAAAQEMTGVIVKKMAKLVHAAVYRSFTAYAHASDRSISPEDLESEVNAGLVYGIHRYDPKGKLEPYNYLNGVIHIVLINAHVRRNRMKRIPRDMLVSLDTMGVDDEDSTLNECLGTELCLEQNVLARCEVESLFKDLDGKSVCVRDRKVMLKDVVKLLMDGGNVNSTAKDLDVSRSSLRRIIKSHIVPILEEQQ